MNETGISRIKRVDELTISTRNSLRFSKYDDNFDRFVYLFFSLNNQQVKKEIDISTAVLIEGGP